MNKYTPESLLSAAYALIRPRSRWTTGELARDEMGRKVVPGSSKACCWCGIGAIYRCAPRDTKVRQAALQLLSDTAHDMFYVTVPTVNDARGHVSMLHVYQYAISRARKMAA